MTILKWILLKIVYPAFYRLAACRPMRRKAVFAEVRQRSLSDNYELLVQRLEDAGDVEVCVTCMDNLHGGAVQMVKDTLHFLWECGNAQTIFVNDTANFFGAFRLRRGSRMIQVWHACGAFKRWGCSIADKEYGSSRRDMERFPAHRNYSLVPVSGEDVAFAYADAFGLPENTPVVQAMGVSRTDIFFRDEFRRRAAGRLAEMMPESMGRRVILYAPTFRGQARNASSPDEIHWEQWRARLGDDSILLVKHHPFVKERPQIPASCRGFARDMTDEMTIEELLTVADVLITDYSSCIFEYALMEKPMIFWAFDEDTYEDARGFYFPYEEFVPGPVVRREEDVLQLLTAADGLDMEKVRTFRTRTMGACDGKATERILRYAGLI